MLSVSLLHGLINTSTIMPLKQWSEAEVKTQWTPRKAQTFPYRSCPFSTFPFLHLHDALPTMCPSRKLVFPLVYEECTLPCRARLSSQCLHQSLWTLWGQRLSHFLSYAMPRAAVNTEYWLEIWNSEYCLENPGWKTSPAWSALSEPWMDRQLQTEAWSLDPLIWHPVFL